MSDESVLGLLLRAHAELSAQCHGEMYVFKNISASSHYESAYKAVESAIRSLGFAEQYVARGAKRIVPDPPSTVDLDKKEGA